MSMDYIRRTYGVPARRGDRIIYGGITAPIAGTITMADGAYLRVRFDGWKKSVRLHPTWRITYLPSEQNGLPQLP